MVGVGDLAGAGPVGECHVGGVGAEMSGRLKGNVRCRKRR